MNTASKGTVFYLDTKLVLRALGFSWKAQVESTREMVRLRRDKYEARIGIFPQTMSEVENALASAGRAIQENRSISWDEELKLYSELYPEESSMMCDFSSNFSELLYRELGISEPTQFDWNKPELRKYNIDVTKIADYIEDKCGWRRGAINNDVEVINQINILRKADYTQQYGGKNKLPVFVTSNSKLAYTFRDYITEGGGNKKGWSSHALPVISDNMLLYRIWLPFAAEYTNLPALTLSRFAHAAQSEGIVFFEKFRETASSLEKIKNVDLINTTEATRRKIEDLLIRESDGDPERITDEIVATSFDEFLRLEQLSLIKENQTLSEQKATRDSQVVELLSQKFVNKIGPWRILLFISKGWWLLAFLLLFTITSAISESVFVRSLSFIPVAMQVIPIAMDKLFDDHKWRSLVYKKALVFVKAKYIKKIEKKLDKRGYTEEKDAVISYCIEHTKIFSRDKQKTH